MTHYSGNDKFENMVYVLSGLGITVNEAVDTIKELQQYLYDQLRTASSVITENPKQKSDLEISNRIEISDEFLNLKIDN